jgi:hypothetical protein
MNHRDSEAAILTGDFKLSLSNYFRKHLFEIHGLAVAGDTSESTTDANTSISAIYASLELAVDVYESYFTHHKPT